MITPFVPSSEESCDYTSYAARSGIKFMERSDMGMSFLFFPLCPLTAMRTLFSREKRSLVRRWFITSEYCSFRLAAMSSAILLWYLVDSGPIPPVVEKTFYAAFFSCSCFSYSCFVDISLQDGELGCMTRTSRKVLMTNSMHCSEFLNSCHMINLGFYLKPSLNHSLITVH